jgi:uncharacterized LabA/DUF88 family protein
MSDSIKRVMIFIDGSNFYYSLRNSFYKTKIDFEKFCNFLSENDDLIVIKYYNSVLNIDDDEEAYKKQQLFFDSLREISVMDIFFGRLEKRPDGKKSEKGVDVKLAVDMVVNAYKDNYDIAILVSNDADFIPAIEEIKALGKQVINVSFPKTKSYHLNKVCSKTIKVNDISEYLRE